ncbi:fungal hydrophobin-domain-containing protein [Cyathus striatus]|nr:fungal hydrophobin-domain-containing protein [Cyathus striatus]
MFSKVAIVVSALVLAVSAGQQCNTGDMQCCNSVKEASSPSIAGLLGALGIAVGSITGQVGVTCSPITAIGAGGNSCTQQPVCCEGNNFNGIVALGCTPINVGL